MRVREQLILLIFKETITSKKICNIMHIYTYGSENLCREANTSMTHITQTLSPLTPHPYPSAIHADGRNRWLLHLGWHDVCKNEKMGRRWISDRVLPLRTSGIEWWTSMWRWRCRVKIYMYINGRYHTRLR